MVLASLHLGRPYCRRLGFRCLEVRPMLSGSTEMRALRTSSNFNGCKDTGFAFGIFIPQMASDIDHAGIQLSIAVT